MATEDPHASENGKLSADTGIEQVQFATSDPLSVKGKARRRFARAGAGATGVLLTLHSQPGMACTFCGVSMSAAVSAVGKQKTTAVMSHQARSPVCYGKLPREWTTMSWPKGCASGDLFRKHFSCSSRSPYYNVTCKSIMAGSSKDPSRMAQYILAAYLNVLSNRVNFLTVGSLQELWIEWSTKGYYAPMAGQRWYTNDIVGYLYGTMD
ncbi:hypothetical protein [Massilia aerilata]|uniref:Uncharacterized protein n=1 Tax=Massilia aerilata TaxID=453817 RepID=A0ABW0S5K3_9BURK